jgi:ABC-type Na+ efflux pump permease subunit
VLPIVQRELQTAARHPKLYRWRILSGLAVTFIASFVVLFNQSPRHRGGFFELFASLALILCLVEGLRKTADAITTERREGTLGLLFLSTLSGWDIMLGKLASAAIRSLSTLLIFVPVIAVTLLLGGTTGGEFWRNILLLMIALLASLCLCLSLSAITREGSFAASLTTLIVLAFAPLLSFVHPASAKWIMPLSPFFAQKAASDAYYSFDRTPYCLGIIYLTVIALTSIIVGSVVLPRTWQDKPRRGHHAARLDRTLSRRLLRVHRAMLDRNPIMWLMFNPRSNRNFRAFLIVLFAVTMIGTGTLLYGLPFSGSLPTGIEFVLPILALILLAFVMSVRVARSTSRNFFEARENGVLELLLSTPVRVPTIVRGQWLALREDILPAAILFTLLGLTLFYFAIVAGDAPPALYGLKMLAEAALGLVALAVVGVWMGLTSKTPGRAFFKTIIIGLVVPHLVCTPTLVNQVVVILVAADKLNANFRRFVAEKYLASGTLAPVPPVGSAAPPVLRSRAL